MAGLRSWLRYYLGYSIVEWKIDTVVRTPLLEVLNELRELKDAMAADKTALNEMLAGIKVSADKIADKLAAALAAKDAGEQEQVNDLLEDLRPTENFLRALAQDPTEEAVNEGSVVPDLPPVAGEPAPSSAQDPDVADVVQDNVAGETPVDESNEPASSE